MFAPRAVRRTRYEVNTRHVPYVRLCVGRSRGRRAILCIPVLDSRRAIRTQHVTNHPLFIFRSSAGSTFNAIVFKRRDRYLPEQGPLFGYGPKENCTRVFFFFFISQTRMYFVRSFIATQVASNGRRNLPQSERAIRTSALLHVMHVSACVRMCISVIS